MTRWYRSFVGTATDAKLGEVTLIADCSRSVALAIWHVILESAADSNAGGAFKATPRNVAATLQEPVATVDRVFAALTELKMIAEGVVLNWKKRQFESDNSTARSRKHRDQKKKGNKNNSDDHGSAGATLHGRDATAPDTDTDTDTKINADETRAKENQTESFEALKAIADRCVAIGGDVLGNSQSSTGLTDLSTIAMWQREGCSVETDILPAIATVCLRRKGKAPITSWQYFTAAVGDAKARRLGTLPVTALATAHIVQASRPAWLVEKDEKKRKVAEWLASREAQTVGSA